MEDVFARWECFEGQYESMSNNEVCADGIFHLLALSSLVVTRLVCLFLILVSVPLSSLPFADV